MSANNDMLVPVQNAHVNPSIEFRDGQFLWKMQTEGGAVIEQFRSHAQVREAFSGLPVDSGWLAPEIVRWGDGRHGEWAVAHIPPGCHELEITNDGSGEPHAFERITCPLPGMIMFGISNQYYVFAHKNSRLDAYQEIKRCPLPNVDQSGLVCWGHLSPPRATAKTIIDAWKIFITSTFNNHYASGKSKKHRDDVRLMLKEVAGTGEDYPARDDLVRQVDVTGVTLDKAIREFFKTGKMPE
jgi:hypothetical protein